MRGETRKNSGAAVEMLSWEIGLLELVESLTSNVTLLKSLNVSEPPVPYLKTRLF